MSEVLIVKKGKIGLFATCFAHIFYMCFVNLGLILEIKIMARLKLI